MTKIQSNQSGFSPVELILAVVILILIGTAGWVVYKDRQAPNNMATTNSYAGWKLYRDTNYGFTFRYPSGDSIERARCPLDESSAAAKAIGYCTVDVLQDASQAGSSDYRDWFTIGYSPNIVLTVKSVESYLGTGNTYQGTFNGRRAIIVRVYGFDGTNYTYFTKNSRGQVLSFTGWDGTGRKIVSSLVID